MLAGKLYQCPYDKATSCVMEDPCLGCESFKGKEADGESKKKESVSTEEYLKSVESIILMSGSCVSVETCRVCPIANNAEQCNYELHRKEELAIRWRNSNGNISDYYDDDDTYGIRWLV